MRFPLHITTDAIGHQVRNGLKGVTRYPMVLMLEPLYTCNLACLGCAIERHTGRLEDRMPLEDCLQAVEETRAPIVSLCGGEPTIYPELKELVEGIISRKRHIYLCTNALLLDTKVFGKIAPHKRLTLNIHLDGMQWRDGEPTKNRSTRRWRDERKIRATPSRVYIRRCTGATCWRICKTS